MQRGGDARLVLTQFRQFEAGDALLLGRFHLTLRLFGDDIGGLIKRAFRLAFGLLRLHPADVQKGRLAGADIGGQHLETVGLPRLTFQAFDLAFQLGGDVFQPLQIGLGGAQAKLGLVAAGMQAGNAGRLFQQLAAGLRLGVDELADTPLPDHGRRARAGGGVGKQQLHILGAGLLAVDTVDGAVFALDAACDLNFIGIVEGGGGSAVGIVEIKADFGGVAGRAIAGAGKDDVIHAGGAHVLVGILAHHPAQRFDQIGLAAAVRPDHSGQAALDEKFGRFDKGLETDEAQLVELHAAPLALPMERALSDAVEKRRHGFNRHVPRILLPVNQEGRRGVDGEFIRATLHRSIDFIEKLLVRQAGFESLLCVTGNLDRLHQRVADILVGWSRPGALLLEQHGDHREILFRRCQLFRLLRVAACQHEGGGCDRIEREFADDELHLAAIDILRLDRVEGDVVEVCAMRAGHRHVFDDLDRGIGTAERHFRQGAGLQRCSHVDIALRFRLFLSESIGNAERKGKSERCDGNTAEKRAPGHGHIVQKHRTPV
ncbi:hypothetical protein D3C80_672580 [compost metagenome]